LHFLIQNVLQVIQTGSAAIAITMEVALAHTCQEEALRARRPLKTE
jgi:hypothetical protein